MFEACFGGTLPLTKKKVFHTSNERLGEIMEDQEGRRLFGEVIQGYESSFQGDDEESKMMRAMAMDLPIRSLSSFGVIGLKEIEEKIAEWNKAI